MRMPISFGRSTVIALLFGTFLGFVLSFLILPSGEKFEKWNPYKDWGAFPSFQDLIPSIVADSHQEVNLTHGDHNHEGVADVASVLKQQVRILCWVMTQPSSHQTKARHVKATWGRRCNYLLFMSSEADPSLPAIGLKVSEGRNALWAKTKEAFKYVHQHYLYDVDWVLKADDDTYVVIENLRYVLSQHNASEPVYMGCQFKPYVKQGYMSGGAGYVLSKEAVRAFVEDALPKKTCRQDGGGAEDVEIGKCLEQVGVRTIDSRDQFGRHRFFPLNPSFHLKPQSTRDSFWFWDYIYYPVGDGYECCSDTSISFHYIAPNDMYVFEFFIYHVKPYGVQHDLSSNTPQPPISTNS